MAESFKAFGPKKEYEGAVITLNTPRAITGVENGQAVFDRKEGAALEIGGDEHPWPFKARTGPEEAALNAHPWVKQVPPGEAAAEEDKRAADQHNATIEAAKMARENEVDLADVQGSGANSKITRGDVEQAIAAKEGANA